MHVIASPCVGTKDTACMPVCPVDCIYLQDPKDLTKLTNDKGRDYPVAIGNLTDKEYPTPNNTMTKEKDLVGKMVFIKEDECID